MSELQPHGDEAPMPFICLFSSCEHSLRNKGDFAMLQGFVHWFRAKRPDYALIVYTTDPAGLAELRGVEGIDLRLTPELYFSPANRSNPLLVRLGGYPRLQTTLAGINFTVNYILYRLLGRCLIQHEPTLRFFEECPRAEGLTFVGGGYLNSLWWREGLYGKAFSAIVARLAGIPIVLTGQGIGPFNHEADRWMARILFHCAKAIGVRDLHQSDQLIASLSLRLAAKLVHTWDDALLLGRGETPLASGLPAAGSPSEEERPLRIGLNLRDSSSYSPAYKGRMFHEIAAALDLFAATGGVRFYFIPISYNDADDDRKSAEAVIALMENKQYAVTFTDDLSPGRIRDLIAQMDVAVGISYHFNVFALTNGVPAIGLYENEYYKNKLLGLYAIYGLTDHCLDLAGSSRRQLVERIDKLAQSRQHVRQKLSERNRSLHTEALETREKMFGHLLAATHLPEVTPMTNPLVRIARRLAAGFSPPDIVSAVIRDKLTYLEAAALNDLAAVVTDLERNHREGVLIEAGCALGGSAIVIGKRKSPARPLFVFDVFGTIPPPSERDGADVHERYRVITAGMSEGIGGDRYYGYEENLIGKVEDNFRRHGLPLREHNIHLVQGLFQETIRVEEAVSMAHIDGDWYESVMTCLQRIEPKLIVGGTLVIDDYDAWSGCRSAVDDYFADKQDRYDFVRRSRLHIVRKA